MTTFGFRLWALTCIGVCFSERNLDLDIYPTYNTPSINFLSQRSSALCLFCSYFSGLSLQKGGLNTLKTRVATSKTTRNKTVTATRQASKSLFTSITPSDLVLARPAPIPSPRPIILSYAFMSLTWFSGWLLSVLAIVPYSGGG